LKNDTQQILLLRDTMQQILLRKLPDDSPMETFYHQHMLMVLACTGFRKSRFPAPEHGFAA